MNYYEGIDYWVRRMDFPNMASEAVVVSHGDGTFTIYINTLFPEERQVERLEHELKHLRKEHFYRDEILVAQAEQEANSQTVQPVPRPDPPQPPPLPDVFGADAKPGSIPLFNSLEIFQNYLKALAVQKRGGQM